MNIILHSLKTKHKHKNMQQRHEKKKLAQSVAIQDPLPALSIKGQQLNTVVCGLKKAIVKARGICPVPARLL
jgi:hypothetical protein